MKTNLFSLTVELVIVKSKTAISRNEKNCSYNLPFKFVE